MSLSIPPAFCLLYPTQEMGVLGFCCNSMLAACARSLFVGLGPPRSPRPSKAWKMGDLSILLSSGAWVLSPLVFSAAIMVHRKQVEQCCPIRSFCVLLTHARWTNLDDTVRSSTTDQRALRFYEYVSVAAILVRVKEKHNVSIHDFDCR